MSVELCASASLGLEWLEPYLETTRDSLMHILNRTKVSKTPEALEALPLLAMKVMKKKCLDTF